MSIHAQPLASVQSLPPSLDWLAPVITDDLIRVGGDADGGYVLPRGMISNADALVSMGIGPSWEFERHFHALRPGAPIHAYDHTVSARGFRRKYWLELAAVITGRSSVANARERRRVARDFTEFFGHVATHHRARINDRILSPVDADISTVMREAGPGRKLVKMDIEGSEYRVLGDLMRHADELCGLLVEFHGTGHLRPVFERDVRHVLERFAIVHVHANNWEPMAHDGLPEALEITFAPRETVHGTTHRRELPLPELDQPNRPDAPDHHLRFALSD